MLDPKLLHAFVEVARTRSFGKAAAGLNVTQSWLSRQIATLERQIGFKLFDRTTRTVVLTPRGERLLDRAIPAVERVQGVQALAAKLGARDHSLTVGIPSYALMADAQLRLVDEYVRQYPQTLVETRIDGGKSLRQRLEQGDVDVAFGIASATDFDDPTIDVLVLDRGTLDLVYPRERADLHGLAAVTLADLDGQRVASFAKRANAGLFDLIFEPARAAGATMVELSDHGFHRNLAALDAVTILPSWQPLSARGLERRPIADLDRPVDLACIRDRSHGFAAVDRFWNLARKSSD